LPPARSETILRRTKRNSRTHDSRCGFKPLSEAASGVSPLCRTWLTLLFDWHTTLFGYGIALEAHQRNVSLVLDADGGTRMRMVFNDNGAPRVHHARLTERLGDEPSFTIHRNPTT
jgi:Ferric iron reductase FhuF-like transporter